MLSIVLNVMTKLKNCSVLKDIVSTNH